MRISRLILKTFTAVFVAATFQACGSIPQMSEETPTPSPTDTRTPSPIPTATATLTKTPTVTPNATATMLAQRGDLMRDQVQSYVDGGYLSSADGTYTEMEGFAEEWAQIGWYQWWPTETEVDSTFVLAAHFKWSSASSTPDPSGCGIAFGLFRFVSPYTVFVDRARILFLDTNGFSIGKNKGTGRLHLSPPTEVDFAIIAQPDQQYVFIDGEFIGGYNVQDLTGGLGYSVLSGTNRDYGTRCEITDVRLWDLE